MAFPFLWVGASLAAFAAWMVFSGVTKPSYERLWVALISLAISALPFLASWSLYSTEYSIRDHELLITTGRIFGGQRSIPLEAIQFAIRGLVVHTPFGSHNNIYAVPEVGNVLMASLHGGVYWIRGVGKIVAITTNFEDGVLIKSKVGNYLITPNHPEQFLRQLEDAKAEGAELKVSRAPASKNRQRQNLQM